MRGWYIDRDEKGMSFLWKHRINSWAYFFTVVTWFVKYSKSKIEDAVLYLNGYKISERLLTPNFLIKGWFVKNVTMDV